MKDCNGWINSGQKPKNSNRKYIVYYRPFYAPSYITLATYSDNKWNIDDQRQGKVTHYQTLPQIPEDYEAQ